MKPVLAVDWDGTCVEDKWPLEGEWLPNAVSALHELSRVFQVYIFTCRTAPYQYDETSQWNVLLPEEAVQRELSYIHGMLDNAGLNEVHVWERDFKIPAVAYIDNKGIRFENNWQDIVNQLTGVPIGTSGG